MTSRCPSEVALEQHLARPDVSPIAAHLGECAHCAARLEVMRQQGETFARDVFPRTVDAVIAAALPRPRFRWQWGLSLVPAAVAAGVALWLVPTGLDPGYVGAKGGPLALTAHVPTADGSRAVADGEVVPAGASLRFEVRTDKPCTLYLVSVDDAGRLSELYFDSRAVSLAAGATPLPGGVTLDGVAGHERFVAICSPVPIEAEPLRTLLRAALRGQPAPTSSIQGLPDGATQTSLTVEKHRE